MEKITKCSDCKYSRDLKGCYCYCAKRVNRVRIADRTNCNEFVKRKEEPTEQTDNEWLNHFIDD